MITKDDFEVFILTYNREKMLQESLNSILNQSIGEISITIMDNGSSDNTSDVIKKYMEKYPNIKYFRHEKNVISHLNFVKSVELSSKKYVMLFHDDDILHPDYVKLSLDVINKYKNVAYISTIYTPFRNSDEIEFQHKKTKYHYLKDKNEFATYMYRIGGFGYSPSVFKSENLKDMIKTFEFNCGKISDKPFCLDSVKADEGAVIFRNPNLLKYRIHKGQDTNNAKNGPFYNEIIQHNRIFKNALNYSKYSRFMFNLVCYKVLKSCYNMGGDDTLSLYEFIKLADKENVSSTLCNLSNNKITEPFVKLLTSILRKIFKPKMVTDYIEL